MDQLATRVAARFQARPEAEATALRIAARFVALSFPPMPRPSYLPPAVRGKDPIIPEGTDLAIWTWEEEKDTPLKGRITIYYGIAFAGKSNKPLWHSWFSTEERRQKQIDETIRSRKSTLEFKQKRIQERREFQHSFQVGDILDSSWGYEQTNVNFYEVVELKGALIVLREIAQKTVREERGAEYVVPVPGRYVGPSLKRKPGVGNYVKIDSVQSASKWNGKPQYQTAAGWGH